MTTLVAGRELDALVAEQVFGEVVARAPVGDGLTRTDTYSAPTMAEADEMIRAAYPRHSAAGKLWPAQFYGPEYSTDIASAWKIVEKLNPYHFDLRRFNDGWNCRLCVGTDNSRHFDAYGGRSLDQSDAALAICLAALKATEAK